MSGTDATRIQTLTPADTLHALEHGSVVRWWQTTMFVEVIGPDSVTFVEGMCTQAVERMPVGRSEPGLFLDVKAKIIAPVIVHRDTSPEPWFDARRDELVEADGIPRLLLETLPDLVGPLVTHLTRYRMRARTDIRAVELGSIAVAGSATIADDAATAFFTAPDARIPTRTHIVELDACATLAHSLGEMHGLADSGAFEAHRIDAGVPSLHDLLPDRMPAEVGGVEHAVALDAGCYLGQEPVVRLHYRGRSNRTLRRIEAGAPLEIPGHDPLDPDATFALRRAEDDVNARPIGRLTTWSLRPDGTTTALAIVRREIEVGSMLTLAATGPHLRVIDPAPDAN